jgi:O-antigen/teichoic acid export membrane protein
MAFANEGLSLWLGKEFARQGAPIIRWVAFGLLVSALARVAFWFIQGIGRPDLPAKFHLLETVLYVPFLWWATRSFGIAGAAAAWTGRIALDAGLLFYASRRIAPFRWPDRSSLAAITTPAVAVLVLIPHVGSAPLRLAIVAAIAAAFPWLCWRFLLSSDERTSVRRTVGSRGAAAGSLRGSAPEGQSLS